MRDIAVVVAFFFLPLFATAQTPDASVTTGYDNYLLFTQKTGKTLAGGIAQGAENTATLYKTAWNELMSLGGAKIGTSLASYADYANNLGTSFANTLTAGLGVSQDFSQKIWDTDPYGRYVSATGNISDAFDGILNYFGSFFKNDPPTESQQPTTTKPKTASQPKPKPIPVATPVVQPKPAATVTPAVNQGETLKSPQGLALKAPPPPQSTKVIVERILGGVTSQDLESRIEQLRNELVSKIGAVAGQSQSNYANNFQAIALTNKIDQLTNTTITTPTITGGSLTNTSISGGTISGTTISGTTLSVSSGTFSGNLTVSGTGTSTFAGDSNFDSGTLYIDSLNNRIGIGTSSPSDTLALAGPLYFSQISAPSVTVNRLYNDSGNLTWNGTVIGGASTGQWTLSGSDVYRSSGNVGIGTTSPYAKLSVVGEVVASHFTATSTTATTTLAGGLNIESGGLMYDFSTNRVGIGTTSPRATLGISGTSNANKIGGIDESITASVTSTYTGYGNRTILTTSGVGGGSPLLYANATTIDTTSCLACGTATIYSYYTTIVSPQNATYYGYYADISSQTSANAFYANLQNNFSNGFLASSSPGYTGNYLNFTQGGNSQFVFTGAGNVGIGTTSPYAKLSVVGETVSSYFTATSTTVSSTINGNLLIQNNGPLSYTTIGSGIVNVGTPTNGTDTFIVGTSTTGTSNMRAGAFTASYGGSTDVIVQGLNGFALLNSSANSDLTTGTLGGGLRNRYVVSNMSVGRNVAQMSAVTASVSVSGTTASSNDAAAFQAESPTIGAGNLISNNYGLWVRGGTVNGILTNRYGVYIDDLVSGSTRYGIYQAGSTDNNYFAGNVGIGTTSPYAKLSVAGQVVGQNFTATGTTATSTFGGVLSVGSTTPTANAKFLVGSTGTTPAFIVDQSGLVGINTYTSGFGTGGVLAVVSPGMTYTAPSVSAQLAVLGNTTQFGITAFHSDGMEVWLGGSSVANAAVGTVSNNDFAIITNFTDRIYIKNTGNVGIGTTSPYAKLSVVGETVASHFTATSTTATSSFAGAVGIGTVSPNSKLTIVPTNSTTNGTKYFDIVTSTGVQGLRVESGSSGVGSATVIGGTTGSYVLSTKGGAGTNITLDAGLGGTDNDTYVHFLRNGASRWSIGKKSTNDFVILDANSSTQPLTVQYTTGNLGIGTTSPYAKLSVVGEVVAANFTATSTTATSTIMGALGIGTTTSATNNTLVVQGGVCITGGTTCPAVPSGGLRVDTAGGVADDPGDVFDVAERYPASEIMSAGEIAAIDMTTEDKAVVKKGVQGDVLLGIVSTKAAIGINGGDLTLGPAQEATSIKPLIALSGRVPVKVSMEGGAVRKGDRITASGVPGVGMRATSSSQQTVGIALENQDTDGTVLVFVQTSVSRLDPAISNGTILNGTNESSFWSVEEGTGRIKFISQGIDLNDQDIVSVRSIIGSAGKWSIDASGRLVVDEVQTNKLCIGGTCVTEDEFKKVFNSNLEAQPPSTQSAEPPPAPAPDPAPEPDTAPASDPAPEPTASSEPDQDPVAKEPLPEPPPEPSTPAPQAPAEEEAATPPASSESTPTTPASL